MTRFQSVRNVLLHPPPLDQPVCEKPTRTWGDLMAWVAGTVKALPSGKNQSWLVCLSEPFQFAATLLACWQRGITPIILPDDLPGTLAQAAPFANGVFADQEPENLDLAYLRAQPDSEPTPWRKIESHEIALELFTSGSTGQRKRIPKTFAQLEAEIKVLDGLWGKDAGLRMATVSHQHIYGLLFRILWPLATGDRFTNSTYLFWETLLPKLEPGRNFTIISSPAHLKHLAMAAAKTKIDWSHIRIFSSGGPLHRNIAVKIAEHCLKAPLEVLGSTETGGIAWRQQNPNEDQPWQPLPQVCFQIDKEELAVKSPFLTKPSDFLTTGDRALVHGKDQFILNGRLDRIAKVAEKRVSLTEMEKRLSEHPGVLAAKLVMLPSQSDSQRDALGCVVQLNSAGNAILFHQGRAGLIQSLRQHLKPFFEAVTLPRQWLFPNCIPVDSQSKISVGALLAMFEDKNFERPRFPELERSEPIENGTRFHLTVPENLLFLEGHFDQVAVVAGVVQLHWVMEIIAMETGEPLRVAALEAIKFHRLLFPKNRFVMEIQYKAQSEKWSYRLFADGQKFASGRIVAES